MKEKLIEQSFYHDTENVYEQLTDQKKRTTEEMAKAITTGNENLGNKIFKVEDYDERPRRSNKVAVLVESNPIDSIYTTIFANFKKSFTRSV